MRHQGAVAAGAEERAADRDAAADREYGDAAGDDIARTPPALNAPVNGFGYVAGELCAEGVPLSVIAERYGTPCYVYSRAMLVHAFEAFDGAFADVPHLVCYAMKA